MIISDYHKAVVGGIAAGIVAAISVLTGAMTPADTFADVPAETWLVALGAFLVGSGITGGTVALSKANTKHGVKVDAIQGVEVQEAQDPVLQNWTTAGYDVDGGVELFAEPAAGPDTEEGHN